MIKLHVFLNTVLIFFMFSEVKGKYNGDECNTTEGITGTCSYLTDCQTAKNNIFKGIFPDICGFEGIQVIVCCTNSTTPTNTTTEKPVDNVPAKISSMSKNSSSDTAIGDRAKKKCQEYSKYAYERLDSPTLLPPSFSKTLDCPIETKSPIMAGTLAQKREFPHAVKIANVNGARIRWICGGSLISEIYILTAAHCLVTPYKGDIKLVRGGVPNKSDTSHQQIRNVVERITHPSYKYKKYHDIALLKIDRSFDFNTFVRPACLYTESIISVPHVIALGWGLSQFPVNDIDLVKNIFEIFTTQDCNSTYEKYINADISQLPFGIAEDIMMCVGSKEFLKNTCQGNSGLPLQIPHENTIDDKCMYDIVGITSFGIACCLFKNSPCVYTRVSYYIGWIEDIVWPNV